MRYRNPVIYALCEEGGRPFYVGRSIEWHERLKKHRGSAVKGTEAKYQHIRKLWAQGKDFEMVLIDENPGLRYEKYYHWLLGLEYDLTNQKMGDAKAMEMEVGRELRDKGITFASPKEFLTELDRGMAEERARRQAAKTQAKIRGELPFDETIRFAGDFGKEKVSAGLQGILNKRHGTKEKR